jgi:hypothetical protein
MASPYFFAIIAMGGYSAGIQLRHCLVIVYNGALKKSVGTIIALIEN